MNLLPERVTTSEEEGRAARGEVERIRGVDEDLAAELVLEAGDQADSVGNLRAEVTLEPRLG